MGCGPQVGTVGSQLRAACKRPLWIGQPGMHTPTNAYQVACGLRFGNIYNRWHLRAGDARTKRREFQIKFPKTLDLKVLI